MNGNLKSAWLDALRSGKYVQGEGRFVNETVLEPHVEIEVTPEGVVTKTTEGVVKTHCCLGVLAEVISANALWAETYDECVLGRSVSNGTWSFRSEALEQLGFDEKTQSLLMQINDFKGDGGFDLIAKLIEDLVPSTY